MTVVSRNIYPKAIPLHSPGAHPEPERKPQQERPTPTASAVRRRQWLIGLALLAVPLLAGVLAYSVNRPHVVAVAPPEDAPIPVADIAPPQAIPPKRAPSSLPAAPQVKPATAQTDCLEALGSLSAAHLYQSHLNIGLLADGVESKTYTIAEAEESLKPVLDLMAQVDARLGKLAKSDVPAEDRRAIQQIQAVSTLIRLQADALRAYWATGEMQQASDFQAARKASWEGLSKVMGIN